MFNKKLTKQLKDLEKRVILLQEYLGIAYTTDDPDYPEFNKVRYGGVMSSLEERIERLEKSKETEAIKQANKIKFK